MKTFGIAIVISVFFLLGLVGLAGQWRLVEVALWLSVLEVSLSLDNAVVNADTLMKMPPLWRRRFFFWGLPIAVFGMRLIFPLLLVSLTASLEIPQVLRLAMSNPSAYGQHIQQAMPLISGFGGSFLVMVFFHFLMERWKIQGGWRWVIPVGVTLLLVSVFSVFVGAHFWISGLLGMGVNGIFQGLAAWAKTSNPLGKSVSAGLRNFLYLEVLDASFSFDGVLGAFAITQHLWTIMVGLGIGALFVRSFTLWMVEREILVKWRYLNDGAHLAILLLGLCLWVENVVHLPEGLIALLGIGSVGGALWLSRRKGVKS